MTDRRLPPGPGGPEMLRNIGLMRRHPPMFLAQCAERYGAVVRFPMPRSEVWLITDPGDVRRVLQGNHRAYGKRTIQYDTLALVTGTGLLASDAELWRRMRRIMSPAFHRELVTAMGESVQGVCRDWARDVPTTPGVERDLDTAMLELTLEIVARTLLGGSLAGRAATLVDAVMSALHVVVAKAQQPMPIPSSWPTPGNRRLERAMRVLDAAVVDVITARRQGEPGSDVLWLLIAAMDEGLASESEVRDEVVTLIVAGHETVAATLTWTWQLLAQRPAAAQRVQEEAEALPDPASQSWTADDLPYTRAVIDECLRLHPPAWVITRRSLEDDVLGGFELPAGTTVILSPYVLHRDRRWWHAPDAFLPERFLHGQAPDGARGPLTYFPFGAGPRLCIGRDLALLEAPLVVAMLVRMLHLRPTEPDRVREDFGVTLRPRGGLPARVVRRSEG